MAGPGPPVHQGTHVPRGLHLAGDLPQGVAGLHHVDHTHCGAGRDAEGRNLLGSNGGRTPEQASQDPHSGRLAYPVDEAARLTGLSRDLLYDEMRRGNLAYVKVGRRRLITRHHLQQFLGIAS